MSDTDGTVGSLTVTNAAEVRLSLRDCDDPDQTPEPGRHEVSVRLGTGFGDFVSVSVEVEIAG